MSAKSYRVLSRLETFEERFEYLKLNNSVGHQTFGYDRYMNQILYKSEKWLAARDLAIARDEGCDLGIEEIRFEILVHHINPLTLQDIENDSPIIYDLNNLITTTKQTHSGIHYGNKELLVNRKMIIRKPNDTCPWLE